MSGLESAKAYLQSKYPSKDIDIIYGYSVYNLDLDKVVSRVYKAFNLTEWVKVDADTDAVQEYYREFYFETAEGVISIAYDCDTWKPIEYYKASNRRGFSERIKYNFDTGEEMTCDLFGTLDQMFAYIPSKILAKILELPYKIEYFSKKPYGYVVGISEQGS